MASPDTGGPGSSSRRKRKLSWIWIIPLLAALGAFSLVVRAWMEAGPVITITFATADGLEAGKTQIRFKDVTVGTVRSIRLAPDRSKVYVQADLAKEAASLAQAGTSFWVVRPRLGLSGVSGLGTLVSGAYIAVDAPTGKAVDATPAAKERKTDFVGLEVPPEVAYDRAGKRFTLSAHSLGSLDIGSPVYYRHITVGQVVGYHLADSGDRVEIEVFIDAPHDKFVIGDTRFWNASGIDFTVNAQGVALRTQSLLSVAIGGVAFEEVAGTEPGPARAGARFILFGDEESAKAKPNGDPLPIRIRFDQSIRGLAVGAPIDFNGITLGQVESITMDLDADSNRFYAVVLSTLYPERLGAVYEKIRVYAGEDPTKPSGLLLKSLIGRGLRAQLRTANMLTGQLYVALDVFRDARPVEFTMSNPANIPSIAGNLELLQEQLMSIVKTVENIPFDKIGADLRGTLASASRLMNRLDKQVSPELQTMLRQASKSLEAINGLVASDAPLPANTERAVQEISRAARSLRGLSDYLQNHPESLIQGRAKDPVPAVGGTRK
jgi:paraquat-inducible protein B